jgi:hypothetical protein
MDKLLTRSQKRRAQRKRARLRRRTFASLRQGWSDDPDESCGLTEDEAAARDDEIVAAGSPISPPLRPIWHQDRPEQKAR